MEKFKDYIEGYKLEYDEYLLKIRKDGYNDPNHPEDYQAPTGFMTKFNKDKSMPISFMRWCAPYGKDADDLKIYVVKETFRSGWKFIGVRTGKSQNWVQMEHPLGYTVEIYLHEFEQLIKKITIIKGELLGTFKWEKYKLTTSQNDFR